MATIVDLGALSQYTQEEYKRAPKQLCWVLLKPVNGLPSGNYQRTNSGFGISGCRDNLCQALAEAVVANMRLLDDDNKLCVAMLCGANRDVLVSNLAAIHYLEKQFNVPTRAELLDTNLPLYYVLRLDSFWAQKTYLLSLVILVYRMTLRSDVDPTNEKEFENFLLKTSIDAYWTGAAGYPAARDGYKFLLKFGGVPTEPSGIGNRNLGIGTTVSQFIHFYPHIKIK